MAILDLPIIPFIQSNFLANPLLQSIRTWAVVIVKWLVLWTNGQEISGSILAKLESDD